MSETTNPRRFAPSVPTALQTAANDFFRGDDEESEMESKKAIGLMLKADAVRMVIFLEEKLDKEGLHIKEVRAATVRSGATS